MILRFQILFNRMPYNVFVYDLCGIRRYSDSAANQSWIKLGILFEVNVKALITHVVVASFI